MRKTTRKKIAPMVITAIVVLVAAPLAVMTLGAVGMMAGVSLSAALALLPFGALCAAVAVGTVKALLERLDEIDGGEEEEAGRY